MTDMQEQLDKIVEEHDREAKQVATFLQGQLVMTLYSEGVEKRKLPGMLGDHVKMIDVEQGVDADGNYLPWCTIVTESGQRIRVTVAPE